MPSIRDIPCRLFPRGAGEARTEAEDASLKHVTSLVQGAAPARMAFSWAAQNDGPRCHIWAGTSV
ncbi:hypothetical protein J4G37_21880 [Microvirga sp. 3-52]|nr:hypothetical protein [Microvirga sp. 3-52]